MIDFQDGKVIELTLPAEVEFVGVARLMISGVANRLGFSYDEIEDLKLAVAEACTNSVRHAYEDSVGGTLRIECIMLPDRLTIKVIDTGNSFDASQAKLAPLDTSKDIEELNEGGLGLYLIHTLMDEVEINTENGVVVVMTKYVQRDEVDFHDDEFTQTRAE
ncbi:anti-sigma B factor RsbW [Brevibacillus sp. SYSU BS000544]|uniref:anti-sigma B factor RsbW n=1 Tax=Brevibacillus sp. SYSU BS000544 TaxID=3416443 RepID=UPI003CE5744D